jgi:predicted metal-dependent hydrolase
MTDSDMIVSDAGGLPPYRVRRSRRARRAHLVVTPEQGLVVVVPMHVALRRVPDIVASRRDWIERSLARCAPERTRFLAREQLPLLPNMIDLLAIGKLHFVEYSRSGDSRSSARERDQSKVVVSGPFDEQAQRQALLRWLGRAARTHLVGWLEQLSAEQQLTITRVSIRSQRARWGSCSAEGIISLNQNLLFLPPRLVRLVLVHELCHRIELNHSERFWRQLAAREPQLESLTAELRSAAHLVPRWAAPTVSNEPLASG